MMRSKFDAMGFPVKPLSEKLPDFPETRTVKEKETGKVFHATKHEGVIYFIHTKRKLSDTGRYVETKTKAIVSPFRLNKYFE